MSADNIVSSALAQIPSIVGVGVIDMGSGMLLSVKTSDNHPQQVLDLLSAATRDLFEGEMVTTIEDLWRKMRGVQGNEHYFREILISSNNFWHFFGRLHSNPNVVIVVVTRAEVNLGLLMMKCREVLARGTI